MVPEFLWKKTILEFFNPATNDTNTNTDSDSLFNIEKVV